MSLAVSCMFVCYLVSVVIWDSIIPHGFFIQFFVVEQAEDVYNEPQLYVTISIYHAESL